MNVLTIGGLDPSGCAGIAADLKTLMAWQTHGAAVITNVTAQNTVEFSGVYPVAPDAIRAQLESVLSDIEIHAVKIGLLASDAVLELVSSLCREFRLTNIVVDPVLRSTTNFQFGNEDLIAAYREKLLPLAEVVTPNLHEASMLSGIDVRDVDSMMQASLAIAGCGVKNVVITGGHLETEATDLLYDGRQYRLFVAPQIENTKTRGLGCTFATILAVHLARHVSLESAIPAAKQYISGALAHPLSIGHGRGPLNHERLP